MPMLSIEDLSISSRQHTIVKMPPSRFMKGNGSRCSGKAAAERA
ncbi:hypothetical protein PO124_29370 [Bacillus licheniformis]|nr:hypothetical protein [Bacillus licheniformis]